MGSVLEKNSAAVRKRIESHEFDDEEGEEYEGSAFNGFGDYFRRKKIKLQNLDAQTRAASTKPQIFKGIVIHISGYTQPPLHVLHKEIVEHGGGFLQYLDSKTMATHIVASSLPPKKSVDFGRYRIVKPAWVVESVKAGKLMPWSDYRVLDEGPRQKVLKFDNGAGLSQASPRARQGYREQTNDSFYNKQNKSSATQSQAWSQAVEEIQEPFMTAPTQPENKLPIAQTMKPPPDLNTEQEPKNSDQLELRQPKTEPSDHHEAEFDFPEAPADPQLAEKLKNMTSEEHNAWLLSDPRLAKSSTANPDFIKQYYSESRLHHLSTWKSEIKSRMQKLAAATGPTGKPVKRKPGSRRYVMHVDFDSFFCAVSIKKYPQYAGKPTVVAHSNGPGSEIASCNYAAREFGVKNGMWMKRALEMCPVIKVVPYDFPAYEEASKLFYESILELGGVVQSVSIDEALVDVTSIVLNATGSQGIGIDEGSIYREQDKADDLATALRNRVREKTECEVSVGIGANILQAKVALRKAKPAGQFQLKPEEVLGLIGDLKVDSLPGVAYNIGGKLEEAGITFVKDIRELSGERLTSLLGPKTGQKLKEYARGIDNTEVGDQPVRKSVSAEVNWGIRFLNQPEAEEFVYNLCKELERRLLNEDVKGKQLTVKIMRRALDAPLDPAKHLGHGKCDTFNKSTSFGVATNSWETIGKEAVSVLRTFKFSPGDLRGLGVQMTKLEKIKATHGAPEGSQKRLTFGPFMGASPLKTPQNSKSKDSPGHAKFSSDKSNFEYEAIDDDPLTPRKPKMHPAMALSRAAETDDLAKTPLNIGGTQFILPSNPDPAILEALPSDIRTRLMQQKPKGLTSKIESPLSRSRSGSPMVADFVLPSQVDAEVFNALPEDMKAEVLASYGHKPPSFQSPQKDKVAQSSKKQQTTPTKRGGIRSAFGRERQRDAQAGLLQTNFKSSRSVHTSFEEDTVEDLDPEFLTELPEDVRKEVIADHRRRRLAQQSGLDAPSRQQNRNTADDLLPGGQRKIEFRALPPETPFASGVSSLQEIKDMLDAWHGETKKDGPHKGDVEVFEKYVIKVICEEKDMEKAVKLIKWLDLIVGQEEGRGRGKRGWERSIVNIKKTAQEAVEGRGLPPLQF